MHTKCGWKCIAGTVLASALIIVVFVVLATSSTVSVHTNNENNSFAKVINLMELPLGTPIEIVDDGGNKIQFEDVRALDHVKVTIGDSEFSGTVVFYGDSTFKTFLQRDHIVTIEIKLDYRIIFDGIERDYITVAYKQ